MEMNTRNPELNTKQINMSDHAYKRAAERLNLKDKNVALGHIRSALRRGKRIGHVTSEDGKLSVLYAHGRTGIYLTPDLKTVVTVTKHEVVTYEPLKHKLVSLHEKELRKLTRTEQARLRYLTDLKHDCDVEIAELKRRIHKTRSRNVKLQCEIRIKAIKQSIEEYENEIVELRSQRRQVARSMVALV